MFKESMYWIHLGLLAAFLGGMLGSPAKAYADPRAGKYVQISKAFGCDCGASDSSCYCL